MAIDYCLAYGIAAGTMQSFIHNNWKRGVVVAVGETAMAYCSHQLFGPIGLCAYVGFSLITSVPKTEKKAIDLTKRAYCPNGSRIRKDAR